MAQALQAVDWDVVEVLGRDDDPGPAGRDVDAVIIATPDAEIASVAASIGPSDAVVLHLSGATTLGPLAPHRSASIHPLVSLPDPATGAQALLAGADFAIAGDPIAAEIVEALGGRSFEVADSKRATYHATAAIAANHVVALMGQVERLADECGVDVDAFYRLATDALDNAARLGASGAITGPAARGDQTTIDQHLGALCQQDRSLYRALAIEAARLTGAAINADDPEPEP